MENSEDYIIKYGDEKAEPAIKYPTSLEKAYTKRRIKLLMVILVFFTASVLFVVRSVAGFEVDWVFGAQALIYVLLMFAMWFFEPHLRAFFMDRRLTREKKEETNTTKL